MKRNFATAKPIFVMCILALFAGCSRVQLNPTDQDSPRAVLCKMERAVRYDRSDEFKQCIRCAPSDPTSADVWFEGQKAAHRFRLAVEAIHGPSGWAKVQEKPEGAQGFVRIYIPPTTEEWCSEVKFDLSSDGKTATSSHEALDLTTFIEEDGVWRVDPFDSSPNIPALLRLTKSMTAKLIEQTGRIERDRISIAEIQQAVRIVMGVPVAQ